MLSSIFTDIYSALTYFNTLFSSAVSQHISSVQKAYWQDLDIWYHRSAE